MCKRYLLIIRIRIEYGLQIIHLDKDFGLGNLKLWAAENVITDSTTESTVLFEHVMENMADVSDILFQGINWQRH